MKLLKAEQVREAIAACRRPDRSRYPELDGYTRDELYEGFMGGGGMYLAARMARTMRLQPGQIVLDLGCGKGAASIYLARHYGVRVIAVDLWTSASELDRTFTACGCRDQIVPLHLDVRQELPFAEGYFDAVYCQNSLNFYGDNLAFLTRLLAHLAPGGQLCIGSEVLSDEFTPQQLASPPCVYAFKLPPPDEHVDVFEEDFRRQHTPGWWRALFERSGLLEVEVCEELDDATVLYEEMVRHQYEHDGDPFDIQICLAQGAWERAHRPRRSLFVLTAHKR